MPMPARKHGRRFTAACLIAASLLSAPLPAAAEDQPNGQTSDGQDPFYCAERRLGYWFYCTRPKPPERQEPLTESQPSATSRLDAITAELRELKARAILGFGKSWRQGRWDAHLDGQRYRHCIRRPVEDLWLAESNRRKPQLEHDTRRVSAHGQHID